MPRQATVARLLMRPRRWSWAWRFRQVTSRRIMLAYSAWLVWSVPSKVKQRRVVNWASMWLSQLACRYRCAAGM
jgi:hypothetical protein